MSDSPTTPTSNDAALRPPISIAPKPTLSGPGLLLILLGTCLAPLIVLSVYKATIGPATEATLPVRVIVDQRPLATADGRGAMMDDVVVIENPQDFDIPHLTINLNGQYFMYHDRPLGAGESLVIRQSVFATKSNQLWVPGRWPLSKVLVTGQLPSGARGVLQVDY